MRILVFSPYYYPCVEGISIHVDSFVRELGRRGHESIIIAPQLSSKWDLREYAISGAYIMRFPAFFIASNYALPKLWKKEFWKCVFEIVHLQRIDLVVSHMRFFPISLAALIFSKCKHVVWIHMEHGSSYVILSSKIKSAVALLYDKTFGKLVLKMSDLNIGDSVSVRYFINEFFDKRHVEVIHNAIDCSGIDDLGKNITRNADRKTTIAFVGRLVRWKGAQEAIMLFKDLPLEIRKNAQLIIIGDGEDYAKIRNMAQGERNIVLKGPLSHEKMIEELKGSDIYLHPAHPGGGMSTSLLEAMYVSCAILTTPNEGAIDVVRNEKNGILVDDYNLLFFHLNRLIMDPILRNNLGMEARKTIEESFNWPVAAAQYENIFLRLLMKKTK